MANESFPSGSGFGSESYRQVLFLDNDSTQIQRVKQVLPQIETIHIPESESLMSKPLRSIVRHIEAITGQSFETNTYLERVFQLRKYPYHMYDPVSGIQNVHIKKVEDWIRASLGVKKALLIDWDRTLSCFEGYFGDDEGPIIEDKSKYYEDLLEFLFVGKSRLQTIRAMLELAHANRVDIFIVTNNGGCNDPGSGFNNFVAKLFDSIPFTMVCGRYYKGDKGLALLSDGRFSGMRAAGGGVGGGDGAAGKTRRCRRHRQRRRFMHRTLRVSNRK